MSPIPNVFAGGFALVFQVVESGNGKQFAMKRIMVNNEADLKLAKQEIAVMVRGGEGRGGEGEKYEERGGGRGRGSRGGRLVKGRTWCECEKARGDD